MSGFKIIDGGNIIVNGLVISLYGDAGVGKTTTALTANNPLLLDFDSGVQRCDIRSGKNIVQVRTWKSDILPALKDVKTGLAGIKTVIVDTADACINSIKTHVKITRPKDCIDGRKMYGLIKEEFFMFLSVLIEAGIDIILIAHKVTEEENKISRSVMQITGGSKNLIYQRSDFMGYIHIENKERIISFIPTEEWDGKTVSNYVSQYHLPDCFVHPDFFGAEIQKMKDAINSRAAKQVEKANEIIGISTKIKAAKNAGDLNALFGEMPASSNETKAVRAQIWELMKVRSVELGIEYDVKEKRFIEPSAPEPEPEPVAPVVEPKKNGNGTAKQTATPVVPEPEPEPELVEEEEFKF